MGLIKELEGVDFLTQSSPLTDDERKEISEFIQSRNHASEPIFYK